MASALNRCWKLLLAELFEIYVPRGTNHTSVRGASLVSGATALAQVPQFTIQGTGGSSPQISVTPQGEFPPSRRTFLASTGTSGRSQNEGIGKCFQQKWKSDAFVWFAARWHPSAHDWDHWFCFNFYAMIIKMLLWQYMFQRSILCIYLNNILLKFNIWVIQSHIYINQCLLNYIREEWDWSKL